MKRMVGIFSPQLVRAQIGMVNTNERSFYWRLSGRQNLEFFASLYNIHGKLQRQKIDALLEMVDLAGHSELVKSASNVA